MTSVHDDLQAEFFPPNIHIEVETFRYFFFRSDSDLFLREFQGFLLRGPIKT